MKRFIVASVCFVVLLAGSGCRKEVTEPAAGAVPNKPPASMSTSTPPVSSPRRLEDDESVKTATDSRKVEEPAPDVPSSGVSVRNARGSLNATPRIGNSIQPSRPSLPERPKADEQVTGSYEFGNTKIEVEGVCSYSDGSVQCWDMEGNENADLEKRIQQAIEKNSEHNPMGASATVWLGKKNRLVVVKQVQSRNMQQTMSGSVYVQSAGTTENMGGGYANIHLEQPRPDMQATEFVRFEVKTVAEKRDVRETVLRMTQSEPIRGSVSLDLKVGAKVDFAGYAFTISSISKNAPREMTYQAYGNRPVWTVRIKRTGQDSRKPGFYFAPLTQTEEQISMVDEKGKPITSEEQSRRMRERLENPRNAASARMPNYTGATGGMMSREDGTTDVVLMVDPKYISKLRITGSYSKTIDLKGIPMDPRR